MRVAITGATGILGRNLLLEYMKQNLDDLPPLELLVLGRSNGDGDLAQRIADTVLGDGLAYLSAGDEQVPAISDFCHSGIQCVEIDLNKQGLGLREKDVSRLRSEPIDLFFHTAALTDLRSSAAVDKALKRTNVSGTARLLELVESLEVREFCYVGSAYACGKATGRIMPDHISSHDGFRNPYEASKLSAEVAVREFARSSSVRCRYFRPSIVCGRLIEQPPGHISKFNVFYALAAFIVRLKLRMLNGWTGIYDEPLSLDVRGHCNPTGGLNIVPADYAAKVMYQVCRQNAPADSYHLVNDSEIPNQLFVSLILAALNVHGVRMVDRLPSDMNRLEALYYRTVGAIFTPYVLAGPMLFDTGNLSTVLESAGLRCPPLDPHNFAVLMEYAKARKFGLDGAG
jgi:nucleoside-diphosphate-sugar epimerase